MSCKCCCEAILIPQHEQKHLESELLPVPILRILLVLLWCSDIEGACKQPNRTHTHSSQFFSYWVKEKEKVQRKERRFSLCWFSFLTAAQSQTHTHSMLKASLPTKHTGTNTHTNCFWLASGCGSTWCPPFLMLPSLSPSPPSCSGLCVNTL